MNVPQVSIKKILYTTDLSETGRHAFAFAASLSTLYNSQLTVMHVIDEEPELDHRLAGYMPQKLWKEIKDRDLEEAKDVLLGRQRDNTLIIGDCVDQYCSEIQIGSGKQLAIAYDIVVKIGDPVQEIVTYATQKSYDLIVVGRHKHVGIREVVHRSVVRGLIKATVIPVFVVQVPK